MGGLRSVGAWRQPKSHGSHASASPVTVVAVPALFKVFKRAERRHVLALGALVQLPGFRSDVDDNQWFARTYRSYDVCLG